MSSMFVHGDELAGYRIEALIGQGGMSEVYRAENPRLGNKVALKLLAPQLAQDEGFRERFIRESRVAAALEHPNVLPIYDAGEVDGVAYIAMRYVDGPDLRKVIDEEGPLPLERALSIVKQVGGALDCAHERGLVHRDVKPGNILIDEHVDGEIAGHAYLADFGVAKHNLSQSGLTSTGQFVGTIDYIAPEQIEGKQVDGRTDVYSLACVLFECLAGMPPFARDSNVAMIYAHLLDPPPAISEQRPELPPEVDAVVARGLAKSRDERYETCRAFVADLRIAVTPDREAVAVPTPTNGSATVLAEPPTLDAPTTTVLAAEHVPVTVAAEGPAPTVPAPTAVSPPAPPPPLRSDATRDARPVAPASFEPTFTSREGDGRSSRALLIGLAALALAIVGVAAAALTLTRGSSSALAAPSSLRASATGSSNVRLTWSAPTKGDVDGYHVIRNGNQIAAVHGTRYADGPLSASSTFIYLVRAFRGNDEGPPSNRAIARIQGDTIVTHGGGGPPVKTKLTHPAQITSPPLPIRPPAPQPPGPPEHPPPPGPPTHPPAPPPPPGPPTHPPAPPPPPGPPIRP